MDLDKAYNNPFNFQIKEYNCPRCQSVNMESIKFETRSSLSKSLFHKIDNLVDFYLKGVNYLECSQCEEKIVLASGFNNDKEEIKTEDVTSLLL